MRIASLFAAFLLAFSGQLLAQRSCGAEEVLHQQLLNNPELIERLSEIEAHTHDYETSGAHERIVVTIPVVVHVIYNTAAQNISDAQINSQIDVLNADFRKLNADASSVPAAFAGLAADLEINFCLAVRDPNGAATTGITRTSTTVTAFGTNDAMKYTAQGGRDAWPSGQYLNLWVCNMSGGILGYAQFPGGPAATDGVVILTSAFGTTGTATAPFNKGRTGTHEVGHWLNLYHIWGDDGTSCTGSDSVADTPNQAEENYGCPTFPQISCSNGPNGDMFMNYMDYTDDACMYMFTTGQKTRAQALFSTGGSRVSLLSSMGCVPPSGVTCAVPTGLSSSSITTTSATVSWGAVSGATSYTLQYKTAAATTWTTVTGITTTSQSLTGLAAGTTYNFQVLTVCSTGSSAYSTAASFTTTSTGTTCAVPSGLTSSAVASTTATVSWGAVSGATSYTLQYKTAAATTWTTVTGITTTSRNLTGLTASTTYNFKVLTVCSAGSSAYSAAASFTTTAVLACLNAYETNNTLSTAKTIAVNTDISAAIGTSTDKDYLKFSNTAATKNIKVDLTNLPADYDLKLYKGSTLVGTSQNLGTAAEQLKYNTTTAATTYTAYVYGYNGAFSTSQCYTLRVSLSASSWRTDGSTDGDVTELDIPVQFENAGFGMFPNPAKDELTIEVAMENDNDVQISVMDAAGRIAVQENHYMSKGDNQAKLTLNTLANGIYFVQVRNGEAVNTRKLVVQK